MIHFLPLEPLPSRYTEQMHRWVVKVLAGRKASGHGGFEVYSPEADSNTIASGQFLDTHNSLIYKQRQLAMFIAALRDGKVGSGDLVLVGDVWYPGLEGIRMVADLMGIELTIAGWHYAGVYDPHDYYSKQLGSWSRQFENMVVSSVVDYICVGSDFHKDLLIRNIPVDPEKVMAYGLAWDSTEVAALGAGVAKEPLVVFPHRLAPEKAPEHFIMAASEVKRTHPDWRFVFSVTSEPSLNLLRLNKRMGNPCEFILHEDAGGKTAKEHYYGLLARARIVYSSGYQETFGYAVHEGIALGCAVCLPARACYPETAMLDARCLYSPTLDPYGVARLLDLIGSPRYDLTPCTERFNHSITKFLKHIAP